MVPWWLGWVWVGEVCGEVRWVIWVVREAVLCASALRSGCSPVLIRFPIPRQEHGLDIFNSTSRNIILIYFYGWGFGLPTSSLGSKKARDIHVAGQTTRETQSDM